MAKGMEKDVETTVKAMLVAAGISTTDRNGDAKDVVYRGWLLDDEAETGKEDQDFPCVHIQSAPAANVAHQSNFWEIPLTVSVITHEGHDPKRQVLAALYADVREVLEFGTPSGMTVVGNLDLVIDQAGESGRGERENLQHMTIQLTAHACGLAS